MEGLASPFTRTPVCVVFSIVFVAYGCFPYKKEDYTRYHMSRWDTTAVALLDDRSMNSSEVEPCRTDKQLLADYTATRPAGTRETDEEIIARLYGHVPMAVYRDDRATARRDSVTGAGRLAVAREAALPVIVEKEPILNDHCQPLDGHLLAGKGDFYYASSRVQAAVEAADAASRAQLKGAIRECVGALWRRFEEQAKLEVLAQRARDRLGVARGDTCVPRACGVGSAGRVGGFVGAKKANSHAAGKWSAAMLADTSSSNTKLRRRLAIDPATGFATEFSAAVDDSSDEEGEPSVTAHESRQVGGLFPTPTASGLLAHLLPQLLPLRVVGSTRDVAVQLEELDTYFSDECRAKRREAMEAEVEAAVYDGLLRSSIVGGTQHALRVEQAERQMDVLKETMTARDALHTQQRHDLTKALALAQESVRQVAAKFEEMRVAFKELQEWVGVGGAGRGGPPLLTRNRSLFHIDPPAGDATLPSAARPSKPRGSVLPRQRQSRLSAGVLGGEESAANSVYDADLSPLLDATHSATLLGRSAVRLESPEESISSALAVRATGSGEGGWADKDGGGVSSSPISILENPSTGGMGVTVSNVTAPKIHFMFDARHLPSVVLPPHIAIDQLEAKHKREWDRQLENEGHNSLRDRKLSEEERRLRVLQAQVVQQQAVASQRARQAHDEQVASITARYEGLLRDKSSQITLLKNQHVVALEQQALKHLRTVTKLQQRSADRQSRWEMHLSQSVEQRAMEMWDRDAQYDVLIREMLQEREHLVEGHQGEMAACRREHHAASEAQTRLYAQLQARFNTISRKLEAALQQQPMAVVSRVPSGLSELVRVEVPSGDDSDASGSPVLLPMDDAEEFVFTPSSKSRRTKNQQLRSKTGNKPRSPSVAEPTPGKRNKNRSSSTLPRRQSVLKRTTSLIPPSIRDSSISSSPIANVELQPPVAVSTCGTQTADGLDDVGGFLTEKEEEGTTTLIPPLPTPCNPPLEGLLGLRALVLEGALEMRGYILGAVSLTPMSQVDGLRRGGGPTTSSTTTPATNADNIVAVGADLITGLHSSPIHQPDLTFAEKSRAFFANSVSSDATDGEPESELGGDVDTIPAGPVELPRAFSVNFPHGDDTTTHPNIIIPSEGDDVVRQPLAANGGARTPLPSPRRPLSAQHHTNRSGLKAGTAPPASNVRPATDTARDPPALTPRRPATARMRVSTAVHQLAHHHPPRRSSALIPSSQPGVLQHASRAQLRRQQYLEEQRQRWERVLWHSPDRGTPQDWVPE